ncbi:hypothetical protein E2C01_060166 [Portunus trituberculatus]|uniref:Uncharacterized protein n=1 Tax=Portunus trituberculatus TaxID=210409 RepID=A0A5B7H7B5_PORTR|nr:hypothetical protein [Portunus trituberculatus]
MRTHNHHHLPPPPPLSLLLPPQQPLPLPPPPLPYTTTQSTSPSQPSINVTHFGLRLTAVRQMHKRSPSSPPPRPVLLVGCAGKGSAYPERHEGACACPGRRGGREGGVREVDGGVSAFLPLTACSCSHPCVKWRFKYTSGSRVCGSLCPAVLIMIP